MTLICLTVLWFLMGFTMGGRAARRDGHNDQIIIWCGLFGGFLFSALMNIGIAAVMTL